MTKLYVYIIEKLINKIKYMKGAMAKIVILTIFSYKNNKYYKLNPKCIRTDLRVLLCYAINIVKCKNKNITVITDIIPIPEIRRQLWNEFTKNVMDYCKSLGYNGTFPNAKEDNNILKWYQLTVSKVCKEINESEESLFIKISKYTLPVLNYNNIVEYASCFTNFKVVFGKNDYQKIYKDTLDKCKPNDKLLFYYTGHGDINKTLDLIIPNGNTENELSHKVFVDDIKKRLASNTESVFIFDCCYSECIFNLQYKYKDGDIIKREIDDNFPNDKSILFISSAGRDQACGFYEETGSLFTHFLINRSNFTFENISINIQKSIDKYRISNNSKLQEISISSNKEYLLSNGSFPKWLLP